MKCPYFSLPASDGKNYSLSDFNTPKIILFFYPKDNTPGCTTESKDFSALKDQFLEKGITVIGVSADSVTSHQNFIEKQELSVLLISDTEKKLIEEIGAWGEKKNYGKVYQGLIRSTFLINTKTGEIENTWKNVRAKGHADRVFNEIISG